MAREDQPAPATDLVQMYPAFSLYISCNSSVVGWKDRSALSLHVHSGLVRETDSSTVTTISFIYSCVTMWGCLLIVSVHVKYVIKLRICHDLLPLYALTCSSNLLTKAKVRISTRSTHKYCNFYTTSLKVPYNFFTTMLCMYMYTCMHVCVCVCSIGSVETSY